MAIRNRHISDILRNRSSHNQKTPRLSPSKSDDIDRLKLTTYLHPCTHKSGRSHLATSQTNHFLRSVLKLTGCVWRRLVGIRNNSGCWIPKLYITLLVGGKLFIILVVGFLSYTSFYSLEIGPFIHHFGCWKSELLIIWLFHFWSSELVAEAD